MASERIKIAKERLAAYYKAEMAILSGAQSYSIGTRNLTRADLGKIQNEIKELETEVRMLKRNSSGKRRVVRVIPTDR